jgi:hypothetical protein
MTRTIKVGGVDITTYVRRPSFSASQRAYSGVMTCQFDVEWFRNPSLLLQEEAEVEWIEEGTTAFKGSVRVLNEWELKGDLLMASITAQDYTRLAADDVVDANVVRTTQETDKQRITWLFSTYGTHGITVGADCQTLMASFPLDSGGQATQDFSGKSLAECLQDIATMAGAQWYVDATKSLHWFVKENAASPWLLSDQPNDTTSFGYENLQLPRDTVGVRNRLLVIGSAAYSGWFDEFDSQAAYGIREASIRDATIEAPAKAGQVATAFFAANAWPKQDGSCRVWKQGLRPGMLVDFEHSARNIATPLQFRDALLRAGSLGVYLRLGEASGGPKDSSGNGNNATAFNTPTYGAAGALAKDPNKAMTFAGASLEYLTVPDHATIDFGDTVTFGAWVKRSSAALHGLMSKGTGSLGVRWDASNKIVAYAVGGATLKTSSTSCPSDGAWHLVVVTKSGSTTTVYIDGADAGGTGTNATLTNTTTDLSIGRDSVPNYLTGSLDEVWIATTAYSAATVANLYKYGKGTRASFQLTQVTTRLEAARPVYELRFGNAPISLGTLFAQVQNGVVGAVQIADDAATGDAIPPAVPTGLSLSTTLTQGDDGSEHVALDATWTANTEDDLAYYELQAEESLSGSVAFTVTASGTGGTLGAGDYWVVVTGVPLVDGVESGQTARGTAKKVTLTAGQRLYVNITAKTGCQRYRVYASRSEDPAYWSYTTTTGSDVEVTAEGSGGTAPTASTAVAFIKPMTRTTGTTATRFAPVRGNDTHGVRIRALDVSGNASAFSGIQTIVTAKDATAPSIPGGLTANSGYRLLGCRWNAVSDADLDRYEIRCAPESATPGTPDAELWKRAHVHGTIAVLDGLEPDVLYYVQVRAVDRSNNVRTSKYVSDAVDADTYPDAGWSNDGTDEPYETGTPSVIGAADVAFNSVVTQLLDAGTISADQVTTGTLTISGQPGADAPQLLLVLDTGGDEVLRLDEYGLVVRDSVLQTTAMRLKNGVLEFTEGYNESDPDASPWTTAVSADGIVADRITSGKLGGGHNSLPNAGFELTAFSTTFTTEWTSQSDFAGWLTGTNLNVTADAANSLKVS